MAAVDVSERIAAIANTLSSVETVLDVPALHVKLADFEAQASAPDLWDDQEKAQAVTSQLSYVQGEIRRVETLRRRVDEGHATLGSRRVSQRPISRLEADIRLWVLA